MTLAASALDTVLGLPTHALVVHAVVVLLPVTALGAVLIAIVPSWSKRFGILVVITSFVVAGAAVLSKESGEQLASRVGVPEPHAQLGDMLPYFAAALLLVVTVFWLFDRGVPGGRSRPVWLMVLAGVVVVVAVAATYWTIRVGHSGAEAVWTTVVDSTTPGTVPVGD